MSDLAATPLDAPRVRDAYVLPGQICTATEPTRFTTVLGSCVAVCLIDRARGIGGLNHYLLPGPAPADEGESGRWSESAIARLVDQLLRAGARPEKLEAKVFGGACIGARRVPDALRIGDRNVASALAVLRARGIPVVSSHTGGGSGRKIVFESHTGIVWVKDLARDGPATA